MIGAGRSAGVGASILRNLLTSHRGPVYPVNPHAQSLHGTTCYATLADVRAPVDLAVIAVPAAAVDGAVNDCITARVSGIVVITAGFGETGDEGRRREAILRDKVRRAGIRLIGPNCLGIVSTDPEAPLNASFAPAMPLAGPVALASQSGAPGLAILEGADRLGVGISSFVSTGNAADVSFADLRPLPGPPRGNIGYGVLKDFVVTLDSRNRRVRVASATTVSTCRPCLVHVTKWVVAAQRGRKRDDLPQPYARRDRCTGFLERVLPAAGGRSNRQYRAVRSLAKNRSTRRPSGPGRRRSYRRRRLRWAASPRMGSTTPPQTPRASQPSWAPSAAHAYSWGHWRHSFAGAVILAAGAPFAQRR